MISESKMDNSERYDQLCALFSDLLQTLDSERAALQGFDGQKLDECAAQKHAICRTIDQTLQAAPDLREAVQHAAHAEHTQQIDPDHKKLLDLAIEARDYNLVNGKILNRSQQSVREILGILSGNSLDGLYGQSGQQTAVPSPGSNAIAKA